MKPDIYIVYGGQTYELLVARKPITMQFLYRLVQGAYNVDLYSFVRNNQARGSEPYYSPHFGAFNLQALDPLQDIRLCYIGQELQSPLASVLAPVLCFTPELWSDDQVFEQFLAQTA